MICKFRYMPKDNQYSSHLLTHVLKEIYIYVIAMTRSLSHHLTNTGSFQPDNVIHGTAICTSDLIVNEKLMEPSYHLVNFSWHPAWNLKFCGQMMA